MYICILYVYIYDIYIFMILHAQGKKATIWPFSHLHLADRLCFVVFQRAAHARIEFIHTDVRLTAAASSNRSLFAFFF